LRHAAREIHRQQEPLLLQALQPVMTARGHQELQARPVPLAGPPGEMTPRLAAPGHDLAEITHRPVNNNAAAAAPGLPPGFPAAITYQLSPRRFRDLVNVSEITHRAARGQNSAGPG
jgi:hypothetical protein